MSLALFLEQLFNGFQTGITLFLISAGLTIILGTMNFVNLAHGSQVMIGAYVATYFFGLTESFFLGIIFAVPCTFIFGITLEILIIRHFYNRDHMEQVLVTFGLIIFFNEVVRILFGPASLYSTIPKILSNSVMLLPDLPYPAYRLFIIGIGIISALIIYVLIHKSKIGAMVRAGENNSIIASALGININLLFRLVFATGATFAGLAGMMIGPLTSIEPGMGEPLLILALVVIIIGGVGSIKGAFFSAILIGIIDTLGRVFIPLLLKLFLNNSSADGAGPALSSMLVYILMIIILIKKPNGLFGKVST